MKFQSVFSTYLIVLLVMMAGCTTEGNKPETKKKIQVEVVKTIETLGQPILSQTFEVDLPHFGSVTFAPFISNKYGPGRLCLCLIKNSNPVYEFPKFHGNEWSFEILNGVAFRDVNNDGNLDIILVAEYVTGIGPGGVVPFQVAGIYIYKKNGFQEEPDLTEKLDEKQLKSIQAVEEFAKSYFESMAQ